VDFDRRETGLPCLANNAKIQWSAENSGKIVKMSIFIAKS